ncbi:Hypothetical predicted protein [Octopus vulgaris]|uniref:Beta-lactamase-related domain-containing protein n=1 Tax=Octopus vulgaris TaxID=6645 RepID=A0AA36BEY4_OCTVU|nr:Hypothetical predicted protein [Octopus vulgaris]
MTALANNRLRCLRSLLQRSTWTTRQHVTPQFCFKQYSSSFFRFRSTFREERSPRNLQNIFKSLLLRLGAGSAAVLLVGSYLYDGGGGNRQTLSTVAECRQPPEPQRLVKLPTAEKLTLEEAIVVAKDLAECKKAECSAPGLVIAVSIDGELVWSEGFGYADLENRIPYTPSTVTRIASISKSITMAAVAKMWENGLLDLNKPVQHYVPSFPEKEVDGEKDDSKSTNSTATKNNNTATKNNNTATTNNNNNNNNNNNTNNNNNNSKELAKLSECSNNSDYKMEEMYLKKTFKNVDESLMLFKDDPLVHKPGSKFLYTTHGWTLVSAVLEKSSNISLTKMMPSVFRDLGLHNTYLDRNKPIIYNRSRFYSVSKNGQMVNAPYIDNSYKWAGGGFLSTAEDLIKFGNAMLYSFQFDDNVSPLSTKTGQGMQNKEEARLKGYLKRKTMLDLWKPVEGAKVSEANDIYYGLGWELIPFKHEHAYCLKNRFYAFHTGNAVGASSILLILPRDSLQSETNPPKGVIVTAICNIGEVSLRKLALSVADLFDRV